MEEDMAVSSREVCQSDIHWTHSSRKPIHLWDTRKQDRRRRRCVRRGQKAHAGRVNALESGEQREEVL